VCAFDKLFNLAQLRGRRLQPLARFIAREWHFLLVHLATREFLDQVFQSLTVSIWDADEVHSHTRAVYRASDDAVPLDLDRAHADHEIHGAIFRVRRGHLGVAPTQADLRECAPYTRAL